MPLARKVGELGPGVDEFLAFVISEHSSFVVRFDDVLRIDGDFSAAAGGIDNILRDGVATGVPAQAFDDFDSLRDRRSEVGRALDEVALVEVVGSNATHQEFVNEFLLDFDRVVDLVEEDGLVAHDNTGVGETTEGVADFGGEFVRVVGVDGNEKRVELLKHGTEFRGDPLRKEDGDA